MEAQNTKEALLEESINRRMHEIDKEIGRFSEWFGSEMSYQVGPDFPVEAYRSILEAPANRTRGLLAVIGHDLVGGDNEETAIKVGAMVEGWHTWSLVLDDDQDNADKRRDEDSAHTMVHKNLWGMHAATNNSRKLAGDLATNAATAGLFGWMEYMDDSDLSDRQKYMLVKTIARTSMLAAAGQNYDLLNSGPKKYGAKLGVTETEIIESYGSKTGQLLLGSLQMGMIAGGASETELNAVEGYAINAGIAYQIADDLLVMGEEESSDKDPTSDISQGKLSFVIYNAVGPESASNKEDKNFLLSQLGQAEISEDVHEHFKQVLRTSRAVGHSLYKIEDFVSESILGLEDNASLHWDRDAIGLLERMSESILEKAKQTAG